VMGAGSHKEKRNDHYNLNRLRSTRATTTNQMVCLLILPRWVLETIRKNAKIH